MWVELGGRGSPPLHRDGKRIEANWGFVPLRPQGWRTIDSAYILFKTPCQSTRSTDQRKSPIPATDNRLADCTKIQGKKLKQPSVGRSGPGRGCFRETICQNSAVKYDGWDGSDELGRLTTRWDRSGLGNGVAVLSCSVLHLITLKSTLVAY